MKKVLIAIGGGIIGLISGYLAAQKAAGKLVEEKENTKKRYKKYYDVLNYWMESHSRGRNIVDYLKGQEYRNIVIYGMGELGNRLYEQLADSEIKVIYAIDRNPVSAYNELTVVGSAMETEGIDAVIVTPVYDFESIKTDLQGIFSCNILSLEDIVYSM